MFTVIISGDKIHAQMVEIDSVTRIPSTSPGVLPVARTGKMHTKPTSLYPVWSTHSCVLLPCVQVSPQQQAQRLSVAYNNLGGILKMQGLTLGAITCYEHVAVLQVLPPELLSYKSGTVRL